MKFSMENDDASSAKNAPEMSSPIDLNKPPRSHFTQNADMLSFTNMVNQIDSNHEDGSARADRMPTVNMLDPPVRPYNNTNGTLPRCHNTQIADLLSFRNMVNQIDEDGSDRADRMPTVNMLDPPVRPYNNTNGTLPRCHNTQIADLLSFRNMVNQIDEDGSDRADRMPTVNMLDPAVDPYKTQNTNGSLHSYSDFMMVDSDNASAGVRGNLTPQSDISLLSVRGNTPAGVQINSQGGSGTGTGTSTHYTLDTPTSDAYRPRMVRDLVSVGTYMHATNQHHDNWLPMAGIGNHVRNAVQSNYLAFPGAILNHGTGDEMVTPLPSYNHGGAGPCNDSMMITPRSNRSHGPQADVSFLGLRRDMCDVNLPINNSGNMIGANAGTNSTSFNSSQTLQSDAQHCYPMHRNSIVGLGGTADSRHVNVNPYGGYHGYSGVAPKHFSVIQTPMLANEQARPVMIAPPSIVSARFHNEFVPAQQQYLNNLRSPLNSSPMVPPFGGTMASTNQIDQSSGHIAPARNTSVSQASQISSRKGKKKEQAQPVTNGTPRVPRKGKRGPAEGSQYAQPAKVQLGPSVPLGKPVPLAVGSGLIGQYAQPAKVQLGPSVPLGKPVPLAVGSGLFGQYAQPAKVQLGPSVPLGKPVPLAVGSGLKPGLPIAGSQLSRSSPFLVRPPIKSGGIPPAPATSLRSQKKIPKVPNPIPSSANQTTATYHLKCKFDEPIVSIGENCPICRRDLIFTPTGTVTQPSIPPPVAVLSCGHTFHDECLQNITPSEEAKNPPCIPCAIGKF